MKENNYDRLPENLECSECQNTISLNAGNSFQVDFVNVVCSGCGKIYNVSLLKIKMYKEKKADSFS